MSITNVLITWMKKVLNFFWEIVLIYGVCFFIITLYNQIKILIIIFYMGWESNPKYFIRWRNILRIELTETH